MAPVCFVTEVLSTLRVRVPVHALRCGPETSVTSPLRWQCFQLGGHKKTYIQSSRPWEYVWSAVRLQAKSLWRVFWVCANVSGLFVELQLLAIMESARRWSTKWVELLRVLIPTQAL